VRLAPLDLDPARLVDALRDGWGVRVTALEYVAIGGGSHHWRGTTSGGERLWLSVDDLQDKPFLGSAPAVVQAELQRALHVARTLRDAARLEFVVAPVPTRRGEVLRPVGERYVLAVYPFLEGHSFTFGQALPAAEQRQLLEMLIRLHESTPLVGGMARRVRVEVDHRDTLEKALRGMAIHPTGGPLSGQARKQLAAHTTAVERVLADFDRLGYDMAKRAAPLVLSHGEPHPGNVLACDGRLLLLDWDTVGLAPPERDLWWLSSSDAVGATAPDSAASDAVGATAPDSAASDAVDAMAHDSEASDAVDAMVHDSAASDAVDAIAHDSAASDAVDAMAHDSETSDAVGAMAHDSAASDAVDAIAHYSVASGSRVDPRALRLYRLRWLLDDLVYCVRMLWSPHAITRETEKAFEGLVKSVDLAERLADQDG
jgi:spectinomycin phosphotransferase